MKTTFRHWIEEGQEKDGEEREKKNRREKGENKWVKEETNHE